MDPSNEKAMQQQDDGSRILESIGERYLPWDSDAVMACEHLHRYAYASQFVQDKRVLDLASGEGYGSALLAKTAKFVIGIDIDERAIRHASKKYSGNNILFFVGSVVEVPIKIQFDVIVCFEIIEHTRAHDTLVREAKRLLSPEGVFIISTPNKSEYRRLEQANPFHMKELSFQELKELLSKHFKEVQFLGQRIHCHSSLWPIPSPSSGLVSELMIDRNSEEFYLSDSDNRVPLYFVGTASDSLVLPKASGAILTDGSNWILRERDRVQQELEAAINMLQSSRSWKLILKLVQIRDRVLPTRSFRRRLYDRILGRSKS